MAMSKLVWWQFCMALNRRWLFVAHFALAGKIGDNFNMRILPSDNWSAQLQRLRPDRLRAAHRDETRRPVQVDYRDRISVATWVIVFCLGTSLLLDVPTIILTFTALGSPVSIPLGEMTVAAFFLAIVSAASAESVVSVHPRFSISHRRGHTWAFWALPMALMIISVVLLPLAPSRLVQVLVLPLSGGLIALAFFCLYATVEAGQPGYRRARLILDALAYGSALLLFLFVYQTRTRSLLSGSLIAATAVLLAVELLRSTTDRVSLVISYGVIVGLILGQVTWALNYWLLPNFIGGLLLLLIFYMLTGIAQQGLQNRLTQRVLVEFAVFAGVALLLIAFVATRVN